MFLGLVSDPRRLWRTVSACLLRTWQFRRWNLAEWKRKNGGAVSPFFQSRYENLLKKWNVESISIPQRGY
jgi:hypothetical protein